MRTITFKAGRRVWLMLIDGCEVGTHVPVSQPVDRAVLVAGRMFPGSVIDAPKQTRSLHADISVAPGSGTHNSSRETPPCGFLGLRAGAFFSQTAIIAAENLFVFERFHRRFASALSPPIAFARSGLLLTLSRLAAVRHLELKLSSKLRRSRQILVRRPPKCTAGKISIGLRQIDSVEEVEDFGTKLKRAFFSP